MADDAGIYWKTVRHAAELVNLVGRFDSSAENGGRGLGDFHLRCLQRQFHHKG
jgi:hypothetical protein